MKNIMILGSTGSIGTQSLEVIRSHGGFRAFALSAHSNIKLLEKQIREFHPRYACVTDETKAKELKIAVADTDTQVLAGEKELVEMASVPDIFCTVTGIVGIAGLAPTLASMEHSERIGLANKETLVTAGDIVNRKAKEKNVSIIPVDSEHSAVFQCLAARANRDDYDKEVKKIILTASGGPFFGKKADALANIGVKEALNHPNWSMGAKITVDSATLMNKGLEVLEAKSLFQVPLSKIDVLVHRQSIVHSMVQFCDNGVIAQLGIPDMKLPIQYALTYPKRCEMYDNVLDLTKQSLTFAEADTETFRCLPLAIWAGKQGGSMPTVLNGANEAAVDLFLHGKIGFLQISEMIESAMAAHRLIAAPTLSDILETDQWAREYVSAKRHTL